VRGLDPTARFTHVPIEPETAHDLQPSVHEVMQQTPSVQKPLAHSEAQEQLSPASLLLPVGHTTVSIWASVPGRSTGRVSVRVSASDMPPSPPSRFGGGLSPHPAVATKTNPKATANARSANLPAGLKTVKRMGEPSGV